MTCTIDASVFVAASRTEEEQYTTSLAFLTRVQELREPITCPTLVLAECSAALARPTGDVDLAQRLATLIENFPGLDLIPITIPLARSAAQVAAAQRLRGADSIYVAVAAQSDATLVTWDREMLQRGSNAVTTMTPAEWIERHKQDT